MAHDAQNIANHLIRLADQRGQSLSIMGVLKLVYIAHGWTLALLDKPLIANRIEAWDYGPVIPDLYKRFRNEQGIYDLKPIGAGEDLLSRDEKSILEQTYDRYGQMSPFQLSELTHVKNGPWDTARLVGGRLAQIPDELIRRHYQNKIEMARQKEAS